jgi:hypothetical protein
LKGLTGISVSPGLLRSAKKKEEEKEEGGKGRRKEKKKKEGKRELYLAI